MIQNLGNRIKKIQETFNKDLEELKSKQTVMNKPITETQNTLEGINNRITEAEEQISELEDRMVEITATEQKTVSETSGTTLSAPTFELQVSQKKKKKRKGLRKYLKRLQSKTSPTWERKQSIKSRKHRESHTVQIQGETRKDTY